MKIMVLLLSFILIITPGCSDLKDSETSEEDSVEYPDSESWDAQMSFTKDGKRKAVLNAGYVAKYTKKKETVLKENIRVDFLDEEGNLINVKDATTFGLSNEGVTSADIRKELFESGDIVKDDETDHGMSQLSNKNIE